MCAVSNVGQQFHDQFRHHMQQGTAGSSSAGIGMQVPQFLQGVTRQEFEELRAEALKMRAELRAARELDIKNKEPDCSHAHKVDLLRQFAKAFDIDLSDIFSSDDVKVNPGQQF